MINLNTNIQALMTNPKVVNLKPHTLKAFLFLVKKADGQTINKFSIRKQALEWKENPHYKLTGNKNMVSDIVKELVDNGLVEVDFESKTLRIK